MMKISELFLKPIDREIEGVIKADDEAHLKIEVEEYVITNEISRYLSDLLGQYNRLRPTTNGVWISGFFGSGKSHLLKILSLLLENRRLEDGSVLQILHDKIPSTDAMLRAELKRVLNTPSKSILFNIDQKATVVSHDDFDAVLDVFTRVFDDFCGFYGSQGYVAAFERELDQHGLYQKFKQHFLETTGKSWHEGREVFNINRQKIAHAYALTTGNPEESSKDIIQSYRDDYKPSIESFANNVNAFIQTQPKGFRLNFFVDEVGQYIAENVKLMTNLQTIAESLATICNGQAWLFVTSQDDMSQVFGELDQRLGNDFSKIQARFQTKIHLSSQDVAEVIQKRLLKKTDVGEAEMQALYARQNKNFGTLFTFPDGGTNYRTYRDEADFVASYPFVPYQYFLFQQSIESLSKHNVFTGKHNSVGERSMLGVFQDVAKKIADQPAGSLGSFDLMFEGIRSAFKATLQSSIFLAEKNLGNAFAIKLLKTLFLVKYVKGFKATPRNLRVLMQESFDQNIQELESRVRQALTLLEQQTYVQRNEDIYEYLTEEEQDVENEIKNTNVENDDIYKMLDDIFFSEILRDSKVRYDANQQDYPFAKRIDGKQRGRDHELAIDIISPYDQFNGNLPVLKAHSLDKADLLVVLPQDSQFIQDVLMALRTESYIRQHNVVNTSEARKTILSNKGTQNSLRKKAISQRAAALVREALFIASGEEVQVSSEDAKSRIVKAFNLLIAKIYPHLQMLGGVTYSENDIRHYLEPQHAGLFNDEADRMTEAETEMFTFINNTRLQGERASMKKLEERFGSRPYGWYLAATQCVLAKLVGRGKLEAWQDGNLLENGPLERALKNTYSFNTLTFEPVKVTDPRVIQALKDFHQEFFDEPTSENEVRGLIRSLQAKAKTLMDELSTYTPQKGRYPFLSRLEDVSVRLDSFLNHDHEFYINSLPAEMESWFSLKEEQIDPLRNFMRGHKREIYDELLNFTNQKKPDLGPEQLEKLRGFLEDPRIYADNRLQNARLVLTQFEDDLQEKLAGESQRALEHVGRLHQQMQQMSDYSALSSEQQSELDNNFIQIKHTLQEQDLIVSLRDKLSDFEHNQYPNLLTRLHALNAPQTPERKPDEEVAQKLVYVHVRDIPVAMPKRILENEADVAAYCEAIKEALLQAVRANKRINL